MQEILQKFCELANRDSTRIPIQCFFEEKESKVSAILGKEILVDMFSACIDGAPRSGFDVKHAMMNKFFRPDDHNFQKIAKVILKFVDGASELIAKRKAHSSNENQKDDIKNDQNQMDATKVDQNEKSNQNRHWIVGKSTSNLFTGREVEIQMIQTALQTPHPTAEGQPSVFLLTGTGGQGKSELCLKIAENMRDE
ncbi:hypothetical protein BFW01_g5732 [Lasiodiplodia theobromae]|nr:hypothetical protein BFW01_g5732 [Lasiodiplodia theobromae]